MKNPWIAAVLVSMALGCSSASPPVEPKTYADPRALHELWSIRFHVYNSTYEKARASGEDVSHYTVDVRNAVERRLAQTGYVVVLDPASPFDLLAQVDADYHDLQSLGAALTCAMTLRSRSGVVEQLSWMVRLEKNGQVHESDGEDYSTRSMVQTLWTSEPLQRYAKLLASERAKPEGHDAGLAIAVGPETPMGADRWIEITAAAQWGAIGCQPQGATSKFEARYFVDPPGTEHSRKISRFEWLERDDGQRLLVSYAGGRFHPELAGDRVEVEGEPCNKDGQAVAANHFAIRRIRVVRRPSATRTSP
jgi:hypothetical protein